MAEDKRTVLSEKVSKLGAYYAELRQLKERQEYLAAVKARITERLAAGEDPGFTFNFVSSDLNETLNCYGPIRGEQCADICGVIDKALSSVEAETYECWRNIRALANSAILEPEFKAAVQKQMDTIFTVPSERIAIAIPNVQEPSLCSPYVGD